MFEAILNCIQEFDTIIIHRHHHPDGDAMGSQIGMKHIIKENFPEKTVYTVGDEPKHFGFMADSAMDDIPDSTYEGALAIILDTAATHLISDDRYKLAAKTARMDHHIFCEKIADAEVVDTSYESCCGLITQFAVECGLRLSPIAAQSLYTGMVTDSGRFRYDSTTPDTLRRAAVLLAAGIDTADIYRNLYADDFDHIRLRAQFTLKVNFTPKNVAYIYTTRDEAAQYGVDTFTISRGMVGVMSEIRGVDVWVNFTETDAGVLCELRSSRYNINPIAVKYGGGGHQKASGATVPDRETAMQMLADLQEIVEVKE